MEPAPEPEPSPDFDPDPQPDQNSEDPSYVPPSEQIVTEAVADPDSGEGGEDGIGSENLSGNANSLFFDDGNGSSWSPESEVFQENNFEVFLTMSLDDKFVVENQSITFVISEDAFKHSNQNETLKYEVMQTDGSPLPGWLSFNEMDMTLEGMPPEGAMSIDVVVIAKDKYNNEAKAEFKVIIVKNTEDLLLNGKGNNPQSSVTEQGLDSIDDNKFQKDTMDVHEDAFVQDYVLKSDIPENLENLNQVVSHIPFENFNDKNMESTNHSNEHIPFSNQIKNKGNLGWIAEARDLLNCLLVI